MRARNENTGKGRMIRQREVPKFFLKVQVKCWVNYNDFLASTLFLFQLLPSFPHVSLISIESHAMPWCYFDDSSLSEGDCMVDHVKFKPKIVSKPPTANKAIFCAKVSHEVSVSAVDCKAYQSPSDDSPAMSMANALVFGGLSCMVVSFNQSALRMRICTLYLSSEGRQVFLTI